MLAPLLLGLISAADTSLVWPMLATDAGIAAAAIIDALWARKPLIGITRSLATGVFSIGRSNQVSLQLRSSSSRALHVEVNQDLFDNAHAANLPLKVELPARGRASATYSVRPDRRGAYELGDHWVRYRSPLGLWIRQQRVSARDSVRVYPDVQAVHAHELMARQNRAVDMVRASRLKGGESEFEALREYTRDDEYRSVDWKATARKSKLICRQYQLERNQNVMFALDTGRLMTAVVDGLPLFDHALNSALMMAHVAARSGDHAGLFTFSNEVHSYVAPTGGRQMARQIIQATFAVHPTVSETDYQAAFLRVASRLRKRSLVVIMTQVIDDVSAKELLRTAKSLGPRHLALCVLFGDPELEALAHPEGSQDEGSLYDAAAAAELLAWRDRLMRELKKAGALVLDVSPKDLTPALINRYLEVKVRHLL